jgi:hypothetical protein
MTSAPLESPGFGALDDLDAPGLGLLFDDASPYAAFNACILAI